MSAGVEKRIKEVEPAPRPPLPPPPAARVDARGAFVLLVDASVRLGEAGINEIRVFACFLPM